MIHRIATGFLLIAGLWLAAPAPAVRKPLNGLC
jgi:hypothetical protein